METVITGKIGTSGQSLTRGSRETATLRRILQPARKSRPIRQTPSHRSCDLLLQATGGVTIALVSSRERKRRQPRLAADDPAFVGWLQLVRGVQGSQVHFDFVGAASENARDEVRTKKPPSGVACVAT